jgi:K+/H+ antiporter YhaU regulatory subunit KhtT
LDVTRHFGITIAGISRGEERDLSPKASQTIQSGDWLLAIGTREKIRAFQNWIEEPPAQNKGWEIGI